MNLEFMRKDQIYFADKKRSDGSSELYSVTDFVTKTTDNIRKGYLAVSYTHLDVYKRQPMTNV